MENGESEWGIDSLPSPPFQSSLSLDLSAAAACTFYPPPFLLSAMQSVCLSTVEFLHPLRFGAPSVGSDGREGGSRAAPMRVDGARFRIGHRESGRGRTVFSDVTTIGDETKMLFLA